MERTIKAAAAVALCLLAAPASADSTRVEVRANVPASCSASLISVGQVSFNPLLIHATVQRDCNATHTLSVTYLPTALSSPSSLDMVFDGGLPTGSSPGTVTFANLPLTSSIKILTIGYDGPVGEQTQISTTVAIQVSVP